MVIMSTTTTSTPTLVLSLKVILITSGVLHMAMMMKLCVPFMVDFTVYRLPLLWFNLSTWLRPPYLYVLLNGIIITIAAASRFSNKDIAHSDFHLDSPGKNSSSVVLLQGVLPPVESSAPAGVAYASDQIHMAAEEIEPGLLVSDNPDGNEEAFVISRLAEQEGGLSLKYEVDTPVGSSVPTVVYASEIHMAAEEIEPAPAIDIPKYNDENEEAFVIPSHAELGVHLPVNYEEIPSPEMASLTFNNRKPPKPSPEGERVTKAVDGKRHDTLDDTWMSITQGRQHLQKSSDTWKNSVHQLTIMGDGAENDDDPQQRLGNPSSSSSSSSSGSGKIKKEASPSLDELNRRVEAFIKKINEEMRLQRQKSLQQYMEMVNRTAI